MARITKIHRHGVKLFYKDIYPRPYDQEFTKEPEYPPIIDLSRDARRKRRLEAHYEEYKQVGTVEEKLFKLNLPKYYGYKSLMLGQENMPYNCLGLIQHLTRTDLKEGEDREQGDLD